MKKKTAEPKKISFPKQQRSQMIYDAIIEATYRAMEQKGYRLSSTNFIAKLAGVSIGSLYRYFPDKDILLRTVFDHYLQQNRAYFISVVEESRDMLPADAIDYFVEKTTNRFLVRKNFFLILMTKMFETNNSDLVFQGRRVLAEALTNSAELYFPQFKITERKQQVIDQLHLACHAFVSSLLVVTQNGENTAYYESFKKNMSDLFKSILIIKE